MRWLKYIGYQKVVAVKGGESALRMLGFADCPFENMPKIAR